jgi:hypothetical protein
MKFRIVNGWHRHEKKTYVSKGSPVPAGLFARQLADPPDIIETDKDLTELNSPSARLLTNVDGTTAARQPEGIKFVRIE